MVCGVAGVPRGGARLRGVPAGGRVWEGLREGAPGAGGLGQAPAATGGRRPVAPDHGRAAAPAEQPVRPGRARVAQLGDVAGGDLGDAAGLPGHTTDARPLERRDRLWLLSAFAIALLTLLGTAGETLGYDRDLRTSTTSRRTHSLFRQGCMLYQLIPTMPEHRLRPLIETFAKLVATSARLHRNLQFSIKQGDS